MFEWDEHNTEHIAKHGIEPWEVEEAFEDDDLLTTDAYNFKGEKRRGIIAATEVGRILVVIYTLRKEKVRTVRAQDANNVQKRRYRKGKK